MLVCRIAAKAWGESKPVLIHTESPEQSQTLNGLLWTFNNTSFLPHGLGVDSDEAIAISEQDDPGEHHGVLINLKRDVPSWVSRFERAVEIVYDQQEVILAKRESFDFYKKRGYPLNFFDLTAKSK